MIQRIQTLFLLITAISSGLMLFLPFQTAIANESIIKLSLMPRAIEPYLSSLLYIPIITNLFIAFISIVTIFLFKNRRLQIKLCQVVLALSAILIGVIFSFPFLSKDLSPTQINYTVFSFLPVIGVLMAFLARYYIKKDDELVKSADRIR